MNTLRAPEKHRTTIYLDRDLVEAAGRAVQDGQFRSLNEMVAAGLRQIIDQINQKALELSFAAMAEDEMFQAEDGGIMKEFENADREVFRGGYPD